MSEKAGWSAAERAAYRRFVRDHHPDVGGDPAEFQAGLARFRDARDRPVDAEPDGRDDSRDDLRYDGPVRFAARQRGWRRVLRVVLRAVPRSPRPPRVR